MRDYWGYGVHDFGSILRFTEVNFSLLYIDGPPDNGYTDFNAPDNQPGTTPLLDLFNLSNPRLFSQVSTPYGASTFQQYYQTPQNGVTPVPTGPDAVPGVDD